MGGTDVPRVYVYDLQFDDENARHMFETHGVSEEECFEVLWGPHRLVENEGDGNETQPYALWGPTAAGLVLYIPIQPTHQQGIWRPATAYPRRFP